MDTLSRFEGEDWARDSVNEERRDLTARLQQARTDLLAAAPNGRSLDSRLER